MEFLEGRDLAQQLRDEGPLPVAVAIDSVMQACEALAEAHAMGIVHRDLKPANLFCARRPNGQTVCKVLDFGISKLTTGPAGGVAITSTSALMGSPLYMSPEQMRSTKGADAQSDIWALGVVLFELLSGAPPFDGTTISEVAVKVATEPTPPMRAQRPDVPPELEAVVFRCLEKDRGRRVRTIADLARELAPFGSLRARLSLERIAGPSQDAAPRATGPQPNAAPIAAVQASGTAGGVGQTTNRSRDADTWTGSRRRPRDPVARRRRCDLPPGRRRGRHVDARPERRRVARPRIGAPGSNGRGRRGDPGGPGRRRGLGGHRGRNGACDGRRRYEPRSCGPRTDRRRVDAPGPRLEPDRRVATSRRRCPPRPASLRYRRSSCSAAPASSPANCNPPYYLDAQGNRIFKKECVN